MWEKNIIENIIGYNIHLEGIKISKVYFAMFMTWQRADKLQ